MKTVGIFVGPCYMKWDENTVKNGMGGSETWAHEISMGLAKAGFDVTTYAYPETDHDPYPNYHLVSYERYYYDIRHRSYDYFIYSRQTESISPYLKCHNVYMMIHDVRMVTPEGIPSFIGLGKIKKYCYLSEWHKNYLLSLYGQYGLSEKMLYKVTNGYSKEFYQNVDINNRRNAMIWSSSLDRGFDVFYKHVVLPLLKDIPDLMIYVCSGTLTKRDLQMLENTKLLPGVKVLDKLSKENLAAFQQIAKFWVFPGNWPETFCITAVENAAAGNVILSPQTYGVGTTLGDIDYLKGTFKVLNEETASDYREFIKRIVTDDNFRIEKAKECLKQSEKYSWESATQDFINLFNQE